MHSIIMLSCHNAESHQLTSCRFFANECHAGVVDGGAPLVVAGGSHEAGHNASALPEMIVLKCCFIEQF